MTKFFQYLMIHLIALGFIVAVIGLWTAAYYPEFPNSILFSLSTVICSFFITLVFLPKPVPDLLQSTGYKVLPIVLSSYCVLLVVTAMFRFEYSRPTLLMGIVMTYLWFLAYQLSKSKQTSLSLHCCSNVETSEFEKYDSLDITPLSPETLITDIKQGVLVNLHMPLNKEEESFIADCSLHSIPIYHTDSLKERLEKQILTTHLTESSIGVVNPSKDYLKVKNLLEKLLVISSIPVTVPICLVVGCLIKAKEPHEPVFFKQQRIGLNNKKFDMYKFRTMSSTKTGKSEFATNESQRINALGNWLRATRLDEIPQLYNVLKGNMSIIGPRPEQPEFALQFKEQIPFYSYRHIVKPGITGWAQVEQGYTDNVSATRNKLSYDLYYIKHLSLELDLLILMKTVKIVLSQEGAK